MTPLIETLLWCILQVTLVGVLALALCAALRRWSAQGNSLVPAAALAAVVVLTACAFVPWPSWWRFGPPRQAERNSFRSEMSAAAAAGNGVDFELRPSDSAERNSRHSGDSITTQSRNGTNSVLPEGETVERISFRSDAPAAVNGMNFALLASAWLPLTLAVVLAAGMALGLLQLAGGLISVRAFRLASRPVQDAKLSELVDVLRAELCLTRSIELRESDRLATAATIGWSRPVILLPAAWRGWTEQQLRAVLAHELAHVARGDYLACVLAQLSLAIHFYHPLVHWLAARLRLEQELAADAAAAELSGGRRSYLTSLAELALHTSERSLGWPAHTFLPTQGTFLRRIEMLRDSKPVSRAPRPGSALRWAAVGVLLIGAALIAGLRGGPAVSPFDKEAIAQAPGGGSSDDTSGGIDLSQVTNDAKMLLAIRPAELLVREEIREAIAQATENGPPLLKLLRAKDLQQLTLVGTAGTEMDDWNDDGIIILQFARPVNVSELAAMAELTLTELGVQPAPGIARPIGYSQPNDKTVILGKPEELTKYMSSRRKGKPAIAAGEAWSKVAKGAVVFGMDMQAVRDEMAKNGAPRGPMPPEMAAIEPLWKDSEFVAAGIIIEGKTVHLRQVATCASAELAENVADTTKAAVTISRNSLRSIREREKDVPEFAKFLMETADGLLKTVKVEQSGTIVVAQTSAPIPEVASPAASSLLSAIGAARGSAQMSQSANNLRQIGITMHNWHDTYKTLPPPVIYGKDGKGKVPHSWRVALLPFIGHADLYDQYQFDEPWDSEANKKVLAQMPDFYRHPADKKDSTNTAYFVLTPAKLLDTKILPGGGIEAPEGGLPTAFSRKSGVGFAEIHDGTSNTLMVVEAKRDIPWTKPEDIEFDPEKPLPKFGGFFKDGFHAALCDGSVRFLTPKVDAKTLKLLITPQDGNPIPPLP